MFYEIFEKKCREKGISPTATLKKLKISTSKLTAWKNGSMPNSEFLIPISEFLGVSIDYLLRPESDENGEKDDVLNKEILRLLEKFSTDDKEKFVKVLRILCK